MLVSALSGVAKETSLCRAIFVQAIFPVFFLPRPAPAFLSRPAPSRRVLLHKKLFFVLPSLYITQVAPENRIKSALTYHNRRLRILFLLRLFVCSRIRFSRFFSRTGMSTFSKERIEIDLSFSKC